MTLRKLRTVSALIAGSVAVASMVGVAVADGGGGEDPGFNFCTFCHPDFGTPCQTVICIPAASGCTGYLTFTDDDPPRPIAHAVCVYDDDEPGEPGDD